MGIFLFILIILVLCTLSIKLKIKSLEKGTFRKDTKSEIYIYLYILGFIPIFRTRLDNNKYSKVGDKIKNNLSSKTNVKYLFNNNILKCIKISLEEFNLKLKIGTGDVFLTSFLVPGVSTAISILLNSENVKLGKKKPYFKINPEYDYEKFTYQISFKGIISINLAQNIIALLRQKSTKINAYSSVKRNRLKKRFKVRPILSG